MEHINTLAITIAIILLPGLMASVICDKITVHSPRWDAFKYSIYSFLFGVMSYGLLQTIWFICQFLVSAFSDAPFVYITHYLGVWEVIRASKAIIPLHEVAEATLLSPIIALTATFTVNYKLLNKISQKLKISQKYGDENLFSYFLNSPQVDWVYIRDKEKGLTYQGQMHSFSECDNMQEIVLSNVDVYSYETSELLYAIGAIYLARPVGSFVIEVPYSMETTHDDEEADNH